MSDLDDDAITVTLPEADEGGAVIAKVEGGKKVEANDDPITDLKGQFEALKGTLNQTTQRLAGAERELLTRDQQLAEVRKEVTSSQLDTVTSGIHAAQSELRSAKNEFIKAAEAGDFVAQADAQERISEAKARVLRLQEAEGDLKEQATAKPAAKPEPRTQQADPVEAVINQGRIDPNSRAANWLRTNRDYVTDARKNARMLATHHAALADGLEEGGNEYFERLDAMVNGTGKSEGGKQVNIRPSAPVAPGRDVGGGMNGGGNTVRLTPREVAAANDGTHPWGYDDPNGKFKKDDPIGTQEFARRKSIMIKQGHYDRTRDMQ